MDKSLAGNSESAARKPHEFAKCNFPLNPADHQQLTCYDCGLVWEWLNDLEDGVWETVAEIEEEVGGTSSGEVNGTR